jgi:signal transduction histidine kinase
MDITQEEITLLESSLRNSINEEKKDYSKILDIALRLSRCDNDNIRFHVDGGLIRRLGKELVSHQETAVSELIKNGYDADATKVVVTFGIFEKYTENYIKIEDNGCGMSRTQLIDNFMRIASADKIHNPISSKYSRTKAGRKGIGRFAAQRLGTKLSLTTQTSDSDNALHLTIDWDTFQNDMDLINVTTKIEKTPKIVSSGTTITISNLNDYWPDESIKKTYNYIYDLLQPFPLSKERKKDTSDPGFTVDIHKQTEADAYLISDVHNEIYDRSTAEIDAFVDETGLGFCEFRSRILDINDSFEIGKNNEGKPLPYTKLKNVYLKAFYYVYNAGLISKAKNTFIKNLAKEKGGIRVYRNGFRVPPYGNKNTDWLGLDASSSARKQLYPHGNINFFGYIEIIDQEGIDFEETSSREGLIENEQLAELINFASRVLSAVARRIGSARDKKLDASQKNWNKDKKILPDVQAKNIKSSACLISDIAESVRSKDTLSREDINIIADKLQKVSYDLNNTAKESEKYYRQQINEVQMLRVLATLGLVIAEFNHEIRQFIASIETDICNIKNNNYDFNKEIFVRFSDSVGNIKNYTSFFDSTIAENVVREMKPLEIRDVINRFSSMISPVLLRYDIKLNVNVVGYNIFTKPMHISEWDSILLNLYTNSKKAISRAGSSGRIYIEVYKSNDSIHLSFSDNGDGINEKIKDKIFDAFFTTSTPAPSGEIDDAVIGSGLGLKIIKDIVTSSNGTIDIVNPPEGFSTCFKIVIPAAKETEIPDEYY